MPSHPAEEQLRHLHASLRLRKRPEDIAQSVRELFAARRVTPDPATAAALEKAAAHALGRVWHGYTSMLEDFARPDPLTASALRSAGVFSGKGRRAAAAEWL
ncbi:hypothetical protein [Streptomyces cinereoruber]|uniref:hypothetical protein n=1 Tax=Streptomyces cinereoruber TaxID=67260 RepID=UPI003627A4A2